MKNGVKTVISALVGIMALGSSGQDVTPTDKGSDKKVIDTFQEGVGSIDGWGYGQKILDRKIVEGMKAWNPIAEECPLAPGKATQLALKQMKLAFSVPDSMKVSQIWLQQHSDRKEVWFYKICFAESAPDADGVTKGSWIWVQVYCDGTIPGFRRGARDPYFKKLE